MQGLQRITAGALDHCQPDVNEPSGSRQHRTACAGQFEGDRAALLRWRRPLGMNLDPAPFLSLVGLVVGQLMVVVMPNHVDDAHPLGGSVREHDADAQGVPAGS